LLAHYGIERPLVALHEHNEDALADRLVARLQGGESLALVSDAGTPLVSDPGFRLVRAARAAGVKVSPVPGPCAFVAALSVAGLPAIAWCSRVSCPRNRARAANASPRLLPKPARSPSTNPRIASKTPSPTWRRSSAPIAAP
jgi:diphthamide biosynthesis methyltransferase